MSMADDNSTPGSKMLEHFASVSAHIFEVTRVGGFAIARGGYADVWRGTRVSDGQPVALKELRINSEDGAIVKARRLPIFNCPAHWSVC